jgi:hypothetical protein
VDSMQLMCHETLATCPFACAVVQAIYVPIDATKAVSSFASCSANLLISAPQPRREARAATPVANRRCRWAMGTGKAEF